MNCLGVISVVAATNATPSSVVKEDASKMPPTVKKMYFLALIGIKS